MLNETTLLEKERIPSSAELQQTQSVVLDAVRTATDSRERTLPIPQELPVESPQLQTALYLLEKRIRGKVAVLSPGLEPSKLIMVCGKISQKWFLVDTGASVSVLPPNKDWRNLETVTNC